MRELISANDAIWLQDSDANLMVINAVIITDRLDVATLRKAFQERIFEGSDPARFERLRCRVTGRGSLRYWEPDLDFDIARHIVPARGKNLNSLKGVQAYVGKMANRKLKDDRPRWEIKVIEHFEKDASALLIRIHHCIGDGMALVSLMFALMDETWDRTDGMARGSIPPVMGLTPLQLLQRAVAIPLSAPGVLLRRLTWFPDSSHLHGPALSGEKRVAWTAPLDLQVIKKAKDLIGATVNDVLMASVSGAFSTYLERLGVAPPSRFLISMPVNVRHPGKALKCENKFAAVPLELPAKAPHTSHRILAVKERLDQLKQSTTPLVVYGIQRALLAFLPEIISRGLIDFLANKCTAVVTNVAGPSHDVLLEGRKVRSILFWVPQRAQIGIGISILSFAGKVQVGVIADKALLADPAHLVEAFEEEFEALKRL
jgi:diacylglycerol O-acyltransferase / wax synthase